MQTFLFADLVGFTTLSIDEGDEQAAEVATRFQRRVRELADEHGARVVKSLGDGAMVVAGDACEAVKMGLELANSNHGLPPVRVGLNTGPAVERDGDFYGNTVNLAARLSQAARGGEVLLSEATRDASRRPRPMQLEPRGARTLRNARDPIVIYAARQRPRLVERLIEGKRRFKAVACPRMAARAGVRPA